MAGIQDWAKAKMSGAAKGKTLEELAKEYMAKHKVPLEVARKMAAKDMKST